MAISSVTILGGATKFIADITSTADADTQIVIAHGLGVAPLELGVAWLQTPEALLSGWAITAVDATNVTVDKETTAGSGGAGAQVRITVAIPHSLTR